MTEIAFHFNAPDKLAYACRFARKAQRAGARLVILAPRPVLTELDRMLWSFSPQDFVAHCFADADEDQIAATPVVLAATQPESDPQIQIEITDGLRDGDLIVSLAATLLADGERVAVPGAPARRRLAGDLTGGTGP